ncbi:TetR/AcrR family transcriptional regulator [Paraburkholderia tropica]|uniref:TetR/AcrR family transcriptional regulator n=1 Tax=Paraburkholderia tropica TaxID=92647 RepID=UPI002AB6A1F2|nr:TetR/AcrR family transcriptional regulator [Paraburkholderia tropica]
MRKKSIASQSILIESTLSCLEEFGYHKTSITNICDRAMLSRGALLHHYATKSDLLVAAYASWRKSLINDGLRIHTDKYSLLRDGFSFSDKIARRNAILSIEFFSALKDDPMLSGRFFVNANDSRLLNEESGNGNNFSSIHDLIFIGMVVKSALDGELRVTSEIREFFKVQM